MKTLKNAILIFLSSVLFFFASIIFADFMIDFSIGFFDIQNGKEPRFIFSVCVIFSAYVAIMKGAIDYFEKKKKNEQNQPPVE